MDPTTEKGAMVTCRQPLETTGCRGLGKHQPEVTDPRSTCEPQPQPTPEAASTVEQPMAVPATERGPLRPIRTSFLGNTTQARASRCCDDRLNQAVCSG